MFHVFLLWSRFWVHITKPFKKKWLIGLAGRVFTNGPGDLGLNQRLLRWYLIHPCLTLSNIRYVSRVKWSNPGKGVAPSLTPQCSSYWKGSLLVALDYSRQIYLLINLFVIMSSYGLIVKKKEFFFYRGNKIHQSMKPFIFFFFTFQFSQYFFFQNFM